MNNQYILKVTRGIPKRDVAISIDQDEPLIKMLYQRRLPLTLDEIKRYLQETTTPYSRFDLERTNKKMRSLNAAIAIPSFIQNRCLGFVILGDKKTGAIYTPDDIVVFSVLANQVALAIENCQFFEQQQRAQVKMFESEKLTSMGKMASGMSHQVNNRFMAISSVSDAIRAYVFPALYSALTTDQQKELLENIEESVKGMARDAIQGGDIVKGLMEFARPSKEGFKDVSISKILEGSFRMVEIKTGFKPKDFIQDIPDNIPSVFGDLSQLQDVFFNLLDNATDAVEIKQLKMHNGELPEEINYKPNITISAKLEEETKFIILEVSDNGIGMTKDELNQIFNPFFTTKATSVKGTGLGLFVIRKILETHGSAIEVKSEYNKGSSFIIKLPVKVA